MLLENPLTAKSAEALADSLKVLGITGAADQVVRLPGLPETGAGVLVLAGVGKVAAGKPLSEEALRRAAGSAVRQLAGLPTVVLAFPTAGPSPTSRQSPRVPRWVRTPSPSTGPPATD